MFTDQLNNLASHGADVNAHHATTEDGGEAAVVGG